ncbi:MAG: hypothetical protein KIS29_11085 [Thermoplasmata archaeon]|nr:hypothetical protein [Candidatus Sysuiplasma jiujiangense]
MWKHKESKWLVRGGRKVRCYLCGKKILTKGDLFLFNQVTGYYSHQSCQAESTTISGNERRRAVKKIAVGAAVVGAIAAGAGKFLDVSSQSKNSPAAQTILTSQGLIPPALTSDPANPVPGQIWYRSDAGVEAHFDGVQNRVVYSSEINDGNVNVTSKGIVNGLSVLPNDGKGGFGPDTTKGATAPGQYGSPYTKTSGIQPAVNYIYNSGTTTNGNGGKSLLVGSICLDGDVFEIDAPITIPAAPSGTYGPNLTIKGRGLQNTILNFNFDSEWGITISSDNSYGMFSFEGFSPDAGSGYTPNGWLNADWSGSSNAGQSNMILKDINVYPATWATNSMVLKSMAYVLLLNVWDTTNSSNTGPVLASELNQWIGGVSYQPINLTNTSIGTFVTELDGLQSCPVSVTFGTVLLSVRNCMGFVFTIGAATMTNLYLENVHYGSLSGSALISATSASTINMITIKGLYTNTTQTKSLLDTTNLTVLKLSAEGVNPSSGTLTLPSVSIPTNPPVSGTAYQNTNPYDIRLKIPVTYSPTSSAAATLATGTSTSSTVTTSTKVSYPAGITTGIIETYEMVVKAGQYFKLVVTNATIGTVEVQAA